MLIRDPKNLFIEIFFPILLILGGLALSTVSIFFNGPSRDLSPSLFPQNNIIYNLNSAVNTDTTITDFVTNFLMQDTQDFAFDNRGSITITNEDNIQDNANQLDDYIFSHRESYGTFYGNYYYHELDKSTGTYSAIVYANTTAQDTCSAYGAQLVESLLQYHYDNPNLQFTLKS